MSNKALGSTTGLTVLSGGDEIVTHITNAYNSGSMVGDIKGAFLANDALADRSANNNPLTMFGTITETPVDQV